MKLKALAAMVAAVTLCVTVAPQVQPTHAADSYDVKVSVDLFGPQKSISPLIYGINDAGYLDNVTATAVRQGGNRFSGYNWENNYSNAGSDWQHSSDTYLTNGYDAALAKTPAACAQHLSADAAANGVDYKIATIQMAGYVSADGNGAVSEAEAAPSARWKQVKATKGSAFSMTPDLTDDYVYMDEYVNYIVNTLGDANSATGIQAYNLDNEPGLWSSTHPRMHAEKTTCEEIVAKSSEYAAAIKSVDPDAEVYGLALFGVGAYTSLATAPDWDGKYSTQYDWFVSYYLDKMQEEEEKAGKRLIDAIDLHYYSEDTGTCRVTDCKDNTHTDCVAARVQAPRSLYDATYIENSWIGQWCQQYLPILPTVQDSIDEYYPGTKLAMTEYNFGGGDHVSGAIAEADALGAFAANDVYVATLWPLTSNIDYQLSAIDLYTNYDGKGSAFGDTLVTSSTSDISKATSYAAINGSDASKVTLVLTNKSQTETQNATINLASDADYSSAVVYGITGESSDIQLLQAVNEIADNSFTIEVPALSVVQIEISADEFTLLGDVNVDGTVDDADAALLSDHILAVPDAKISFPHADLTQDGIVNGFDLGVLKKRLAASRKPVETPQSYEEINTATWKVNDGVGGKTMTCTFKGEPGYTAAFGYGYWDNSLNDGEGGWVQGDETALGNAEFDSSGECTLSFEVPKNALSLQVQVYYYAVYDAALGESVEHDLGEVSLLSVSTH
ncbi:MAG: endoglucanase [Ruminococcus sp.]|nr:endoglucanase [Ruminococcus sp.]